MNVRGMFRPGMRAYIVPLVAGLSLAGSTFLPWVVVGDISLSGFPDVMAIWVLGLGLLAAILATLSLITRKNSRHPLLIIGLVALGLMILAWRIMPETAGERALTVSQAFSIVEGTPMTTDASALVGSGLYLGLTASTVLVVFGMTIIVKRVSQPYVVAELDDDV